MILIWRLGATYYIDNKLKRTLKREGIMSLNCKSNITIQLCTFHVLRLVT